MNYRGPLDSMKKRGLLGIILVALGKAAAVYIWGAKILEVPASPHVSVNEHTVATVYQSPGKQISQNPSVQQLIASGQLDPPPGNTEKLNSAVSPFAKPTSTAADQQNSKPGNSLIAARFTDKALPTSYYRTE